MRPLRMVPMTSLPPFQARLLAARLGAEGILWQLRGESTIYPTTAVEVLVEADEVDHASALLDPAWAHDADDGDDLRSDPPGPLGSPVSGRLRSAHAVIVWLLIAVVLLALALRISHLA